MASLIVIAGPPGGGKTTKARELNLPGTVLVSTDDYKTQEWEDVPVNCGRDVIKYLDSGKDVILEGVRALSVILHNPTLRDRITDAYWCSRGKLKPGSFARGLTKRQRDLLRELRLSVKRA